ncbi:sensor histidine kinase [Streptomyces deccanensis]|uniref:sensor histidine kinase n=1 Tax=Streptomyces deccanensis TaxID=424188 RepID=UPI001EFB1C38|nr:sensor histidine kinase [Streptomyces deccanensis]ULR55598.1 sensor histidine kinase [Streptomyces deccanensis]
MAVRGGMWAVALSGVGAVAFAGWVAGPAGGTPGVDGGGLQVVLLGTVLVSWAVTGAVLVSSRPRNPLGWLFLAIGGSGTWQVGLAAYGGHGVAVAEPDWPGASVAAAVAGGAHTPSLFALPTLVLALYPQGRPGTRWVWWPVGAAGTAILVLTVGTVFDPQAYDDIVPGGTPPVSLPSAVIAVLDAVCLLLIGLSALAVIGEAVVRLIRSEPPVRQQLAWMVCVLGVFLTALFSTGPLVHATLGVLVPVAVAVGVLRYRMLGIETVMRRGLVYALLTAVVITVYLLVTTAVGTVWDRSALPGVLSAAVVAVGLAPARERLQRAVDWWIYGGRRDPLRALARLGSRMADAGEHDLLPAALDAVTQAVRAPGGRVTDTRGVTLAAAGRSTTAGLTLELRLAGRTLGSMSLAERTPGEPYGRDDKRLLAALAQQVAVVVRALELADVVTAQRDQVVEATRRERDRLRHDLHDGLGPSLAGMGLGLQAATDQLSRGNTTEAGALLHRTREEVVTAVAEIRRIIDDLRPDVLDRLGLAEAVRRHAETLAPAVSIGIRVAQLPTLPPEVESAAYRIITEATTNIARHAAARQATVTVAAHDGLLRITVTDDGRGIPAGAPAGVGLPSMRRRAEARGGSLTVEPAARGTIITVTLPLEGS